MVLEPTVLLRLGVTALVTVPGATAVLLPRLVTPASGLNVTVLVYPPATVAVTFNTTVTVPLTGMVTEPRTCVPTAVNAVGTLAPPTGVTLATLAVIPAGRLSTIDAVVKVLGPALPITMVKLVVPLTGMVLEPTVFVRLGVTTVRTLVVTVSVLFPVFVSADVEVIDTAFVSEPVGMLFTRTVSVIVPDVPLASDAVVAVRLEAPAMGLKVIVPALTCADAV